MIDQVCCHRMEEQKAVCIIDEKKETCRKKWEKGFCDPSNYLKKDSDTKEAGPESENIRFSLLFSILFNEESKISNQEIERVALDRYFSDGQKKRI